MTTRTHSRPPLRATGGCPLSSGRELASRVFDWDSASESRQDLVRRIVTRADDSGQETPGLLTDLDDYLPSDDVWHQLAAYGTRQRLSGIALSTPRTWAAIDAASRARLGAGTAALTVQARRTRSGMLASTSVASSSQVAFTMFVRCSTSTSEYRLLRLSQLGHRLP